MAFLLSSKNVFEYLIDKDLCTSEQQAAGKIEPLRAENFNLLLIKKCADIIKLSAQIGVSPHVASVPFLNALWKTLQSL